jgi:hypothetical protein
MLMGMFTVNNKTVTFKFAERILPCQKDRFENQWYQQMQHWHKASIQKQFLHNLKL